MGTPGDGAPGGWVGWKRCGCGNPHDSRTGVRSTERREGPRCFVVRIEPASMITNVENGGTATDAPVGGRGRMFQLRLAVAALLLVPAIWFSFETVTGLASRRVLRTDLAEIEHARYGILSADQWRAIIGPMLDAQVDKLDLKSESKSLRPMVERSLYALLDNIKTQMTSPAAKTAPGSPGAKAPATQPSAKAQAPPAQGTGGMQSKLAAARQVTQAGGIGHHRFGNAPQPLDSHPRR